MLTAATRAVIAVLAAAYMTLRQFDADIFGITLIATAAAVFVIGFYYPAGLYGARTCAAPLAYQTHV